MFIRINYAVCVLFLISQPVYAKPPFKVKAGSAVLINAFSGQIIFEQNPDKRMAPASLAKLMTLYLAFDAVDNGYASLSDQVRISKKAWKTAGSKMFLEVNSNVSLELLLKGIAVVSGNDACVAVAEYIAGVEDVFVKKMNKIAAEIGMANTVFHNSHGLPHDGQYTTARDVALLSYHYLRNHPDALKLHSIKEMTFNKITQRNRNGLLWLDYGVDGLKTGWFTSAGYHMVATAYRDGDRFVAVIMGAGGENGRENAALQLLNYGFRNFRTIRVPAEKTRAVASVWKGNKGEVTLGIRQEISITLPVDDKAEIYVEKDFPETMFAPILKDREVGSLRIVADGKTLKVLPLVPLENVERAGFFKGTLHGIVLFFIMPPYLGAFSVGLLLMIFVFFKIVASRKKRKKPNMFLRH